MIREGSVPTRRLKADERLRSRQSFLRRDGNGALAQLQQLLHQWDGSPFLYPIGYTGSVPPVRFLGNSLQCLREFPKDARHHAGYQLDRVQRGEQPDDFKPMASIGKGVEEIRVADDSGAYCVICPGTPMRYTCCTRFRKKRKLLRGRISTPRRAGLRNC